MTVRAERTSFIRYVQLKSHEIADRKLRERGGRPGRSKLPTGKPRGLYSGATGNAVPASE